PLVPARLGHGKGRLAHLPRRPDHLAPDHRATIHPARPPRRRRRCLRVPLGVIRALPPPDSDPAAHPRHTSPRAPPAPSLASACTPRPRQPPNASPPPSATSKPTANTPASCTPAPNPPTCSPSTWPSSAPSSRYSTRPLSDRKSVG